MKFRVIFLVLALFAGFSSFGAASTFSEAADRLNGEWRGDDFVLRVDAKRAQASVDASHPFAWEHFVIKEVTPAEVVFTIGPELYEARIEADILTLTGTSFRGARVLFREGGDLRGTTSE